MMQESQIGSFLQELSSKAPVPGGGGASALGGAIGTALGSMVGNLTVGKKKYADVQEDIIRLLSDFEEILKELLILMDRDAEVFEPLSKAYSLPKGTPEEQAHKGAVMEDALYQASLVPLSIMEKALAAILLQEEMAAKGTRIAISDVAVGVQFLRSALMGASMNVFINTGLMKDTETAQKLNEQADQMIKQGVEKADSIYNTILKELRQPWNS